MRSPISAYGDDLIVGFRREERGRLASYIRLAPGRSSLRLTAWIRLVPQPFRGGPTQRLAG